MGVNGKAMQLPAVYKKAVFFMSHENLYQVLQLTCAAFEHAMKPKFRTIKSLSVGIVAAARSLSKAVIFATSHMIIHISTTSHLFVAIGIVIHAAHIQTATSS